MNKTLFYERRKIIESTDQTRTLMVEGAGVKQAGKLHNVQRYASRDSDLVSLLRHRALMTPDACAYIFLKDGESLEHTISFGQLDSMARIIAAQLQAMDMTSKRVLLIYPAGIEYITAFLGCLYAGAIAVPVYPPSRHYAHRLKAIIRDASPSAVLTTANLCEKLQQNHEKDWDCQKLIWLVTDLPTHCDSDAWIPLPLQSNCLAFLQYTSGSTGDPKGVMVSHGNLIANQRMIKQAFNHTQETVVVGWLPLYHDMGLIGNVLQPLYLGTTAILMSPLAFLEKPIRWLQAISRYRASTSGGPNFAYELCVRKITPEQKQSLDLSCWTLAFNGSEPVRLATLKRFFNAFSECGFQQTAFFPCYGLAESTLFVTGKRLHHHHFQCDDKNSFEQQNLSNTPISSGHAWDGHMVCIVNPSTKIPCPDGTEGEIWIAGPSVAQGYWNRYEVSEEIFRAMLSLPEERLDLNNWSERSIHQKYFDCCKHTFLRTGDLGIANNGDLFVTGRIKDLIILRGRNYYPHDLEQAIDDYVTAIRPNCCAAFSVEREGEECLFIAVEAKRKKISHQESGKVFSQIRQTLADASDAPISELLLLPPGSLFKTSSGKIQRQAIKQAYLNNQFTILARTGHDEFFNSSSTADTVDKDGSIDLARERLHVLPHDQQLQGMAHFLGLQLAKLLRIPEADIMPAHSIRLLGLDSLRLVELKHTIDAFLGTDLPLSLFLSELTVSELVNILVTEMNNAPPSEEKSVLQKDMSLSCAQQAIWAVHQLEPNSIVYNVYISLHFQGFLDNAILHPAMEKLLQRHPQLRTYYWVSGESVQQGVIASTELPPYYFTVDALGWTESALQADLARRVREPFDLSTGPLLRITNYRVGEQSHIVLFCAHHAAVDLWTSMILLEDLKIILQGMMLDTYSDFPVLTVDYHDFVTWQHRYLQSDTCQGDFNFWQNKLAGTLPILALPTDFPRPRISTYRGASYKVRWSLDLMHQLKQLGQKHGATLFMTLLAVYKVLLHRYTHQQDIIVGTASNGRPQARFKHVAGYFINPVALRTYPNSLLSFTSYLMEVRDTVIEALAHSNYPFSLLVKRLQPERSANHWPIYQTLLIVQQSPTDVDDALAYLALGEDGGNERWGDWTIASKGIEEQVENFDLRLMAAEDKNGLLLSFKYRTDLFETETISRMAGHFQKVVEQIIAHPDSLLGELSLLTETEATQQLLIWNSDTYLLPEKRCLHELFEAQVVRTPMQMAVACNGKYLTYIELNRRANQLAHYLRAQGIRPEVVVGLCVKRSLDMIIGILGILKAGGAYVPIDPNSPPKRIESILYDSGASCIITQQALVHQVSVCKLPVVCLDGDRRDNFEESFKNLDNVCHSDHLAYIIYTSGSTGKSKGVAITHGNVVHSTKARFETYHEHINGFLLLSSYTFDSSIAGVFWTLCQGGCLHIPVEGAEKDPQLLGKILSTEKISHLLCLPSLYGLLLEDLPLFLFDEMRVIVVAGEACPPDLVKKHYLRLPQVSIFNEYGPTEGTVWSSVYPIQAGDADQCVPIGKPIQNVQIYLLDRYLNPVPIGVPAEIYIGGAGLARGYQQAPDLTAERFIPNFFATDEATINDSQELNRIPMGSRLYRTGDLARYRRDGSIEFLGRIDHQVKIRGFRIELGEIEATLRQHPGVKEAAVLVRENPTGDKRLIAYLSADSTQFLAYVHSHDEGFDSDSLSDELSKYLTASDNETVGKLISSQYLQHFLKKSLPDFMVPSAFVFMKTLPLLPNGKLNRKALPVIESGQSILNQERVDPRNSIEKALQEIWQETLNIHCPIGVHDSFFDLGGHSMSAIRVIGRIQNEFNIVLPVAKIFEAPTIAQLAYLVAQQQIDEQDHDLLESLLDEIEQLPDETGFIDDREIASARWLHE